MQRQALVKYTLIFMAGMAVGGVICLWFAMQAHYATVERTRLVRLFLTGIYAGDLRQQQQECMATYIERAHVNAGEFAAVVEEDWTLVYPLQTVLSNAAAKVLLDHYDPWGKVSNGSLPKAKPTAKLSGTAQGAAYAASSVTSNQPPATATANCGLSLVRLPTNPAARSTPSGQPPL